MGQIAMDLQSGVKEALAVGIRDPGSGIRNTDTRSAELSAFAEASADRRSLGGGR